MVTRLHQWQRRLIVTRLMVGSPIGNIVRTYPYCRIDKRQGTKDKGQGLVGERGLIYDEEGREEEEAT